MKPPIYDRQENEGPKAYAAAYLYFEQGPERSLASVAKARGKFPSLINRWSVEWQWVVRARAFDKEADRERRKLALKLAAAQGRERAKQAAEIRESSLAFAQESIQKAREIMKTQLYKQETKDGKITLVPTGWSFKDAVKLGEAGIKLGLSLTEVRGDQSDFRDERFEHVDFPPEEEEEK